MKRHFRLRWKPLLAEAFSYTLFVSGYFSLIWHFFRDWLVYSFQTDRTLYALAALTLISGQGVLLELITSGLSRFFRSK